MHYARTILYFPISYIYNHVPLPAVIGCIYRVIHKSVKHLKNSQQMDYATDYGNSYVDRHSKTVEVFFKEKPAHIVALICR